MIKDQDTNVVYLSKWLADDVQGFPETFRNLTNMFDKLGIKWGLLECTNDYWARDYMPIQVGKGDFLKYVYRPNYLYKYKVRHKFITDCGKTCDKLGIKYRETDLVIDGGNVVECGKYIIMTDKVFTENNAEKGDKILKAELEKVLKQDIIFIPWTQHGSLYRFTGDVYGHSDGFIKYCGGNKILMSNHREAYPEEADTIHQVLESYGFEITEMLFDVPQPTPELNWAYINFLQVGHEIIMPCFGVDEDIQAETYINKAFPECNVHTIRLNDVAYKGGALHCLTWNIMH